MIDLGSTLTGVKIMASSEQTQTHTAPIANSGGSNYNSTGRPTHRMDYSARPDAPDPRDRTYVPVTPIDAAQLPVSVDLRAGLPPIWDQGVLEACSSFALAAVIEYNQRQLKKTEFTPSRLFIYYNERVIEGTIKQDAGACLRDGIKTLARLGAPPEETWPFDPANVLKQPPPTAYAAAKLDLITVYTRVPQTVPMLKSCLAEGYPILFRIECYPGLDADSTYATGDIPTPGPEETSDGGHFMVLVGYDDAAQRFLVRNSWGEQFGHGGYGTIGYDYILSPRLTTDLWTIRDVSDKPAKPVT